MKIHHSYILSFQQVIGIILVLFAVQLAVWCAPSLPAAKGLANYAPLHSLLEIFAVTVAVMVFSVGWSVNDQDRPGNYALLSSLFLGVALLDLLHLLSYAGMPDFLTPNGPEKAIAFWLAARSMSAVAMLAVALLPWRPSRIVYYRRYVLLGVLVLVVALAWMVFVHLDWIPRTFTLVQGLTLFKKKFEYSLTAAFLAAAWFFLQQMQRVRNYDVVGLFAAATLMALSEIFFTLYADVTDIFNILGHSYKVVAYGYIYRSIVLGCINMPYQKLSESRSFLEKVINTIPLRIFWKDTQSRYVGCNDLFAQDAGALTPEQIVGKQDTQLLWHDRAEQYQSEDLAVMQSGQALEAVEELKTLADGRQIWLRKSKVPMYNLQQEVTGILGVYEDVTTLKQIEREKMLNQVAIEKSQTIFYRINQDGKILYVNDFACLSLGYTQEEMVGHTVWEFMPEYAAASWASLWQQLQQQRVCVLAAQHRRKDGSLVPIEVTYNYITADGETMVFCSVKDMTQRKQVESILYLYQNLVECSVDPFFVLDPQDDFRLILVNQAAVSHFGLPTAELLQRHVWDWDQEYSRAKVRNFWHTLKVLKHIFFETEHYLDSGKVVPVEVSANYLYYDARELIAGYFRNISQKRESETLIWKNVNFDQLTGLPNRRMFHDRLAQEIKKAHRSGATVALLFLDLDRFKDVNDSLGHDYGDLLLQETARRLSACVRDSDTVARLGGDEFIIIMGELSEQNSIERSAELILDSLAQPFQLGAEVVYLTTSIGITFYPADATDADILLKNADQAMYAAKSLGRNRYHYFTPAMQEAVKHRMRLMADLREALPGQQFRLVYQPIVALANNQVLKAEALLRWQHPQRGLVSPAEFIPLAERTGLIVDIGEWVFEQAAQQVAQWRKQYQLELQISVNKSPVQFQSGKGHEAWFALLQQLQLPGDSIVLEITEGLLLDASATITEQLRQFRAEGMQVSIDDFGTGYSSLSYIKKFAIDFLKIDQSFVRNLAPGSDDLALCEAIIVMAHKLGIKVIAEGIETAAQCDLLRQAGCDYGQGYWFSRPLNPEDFAGQFLADNPLPRLPAA